MCHCINCIFYCRLLSIFNFRLLCNNLVAHTALHHFESETLLCQHKLYHFMEIVHVYSFFGY